MIDESVTPGSDNAETPVAAELPPDPQEGIVVTRVAQIIRDEQGETGIAIARIKDVYETRFPRSRADVILGEREFAAICLYLQANGYAIPENKLWSVTEKGAELAGSVPSAVADGSEKAGE